MLTKEDIRGVCVFMPTPAKEGANHWAMTDTVDLDVTAKLVEDLVQAGIGLIATCGTTGENAALLWEEKQSFVDTVLQQVNKRIPVFAGATSLGTREVIRQMKVFKDMGADGGFTGLALWQTPTLENAAQWYGDFSDALPDLPIMVYANYNFFKSTFPPELWAAIVQKAPTVVAAKVGGAHGLVENIDAAGHQIRFIPTDMAAYQAHELAPQHVKCFWSTSAAMGAEPVVALSDALLADDSDRAEAINKDLQAVPTWIPKLEDFHYYNTQAANYRFQAGGFNFGPARPPYNDLLPEEWKRAGEAHAKGWQELRKEYIKARV